MAGNDNSNVGGRLANKYVLGTALKYAGILTGIYGLFGDVEMLGDSNRSIPIVSGLTMYVIGSYIRDVVQQDIIVRRMNGGLSHLERKLTSSGGEGSSTP